ncbi:MAG: ATP-grasp domain-containing protein [Algoriphagus sp.]|nr:ATP-grasp domain-containing protein [Algoriphagus sp.]
MDLTQKTNSFEFWPSWTIQLPMFFFGTYWAIRLRSLSFFAAVNPALENGGLFYYSKFNSLQRVNPKNIPSSILLSPPHREEEIRNKVEAAGIKLPFIIKPDIGERGRGVAVIDSFSDLRSYLNAFNQEALIIQDLITKQEEYGVFLIRNRSSGKFKITSITQKIPLQVMGDGVSTIIQLAKKHPRVKRYLDQIQKQIWQVIPSKGEIYRLSIKGNHCKGATFVDRRDLICEKTEAAFSIVCKDFTGFNYGRLDLKVDTEDELKNPDAILLLEINGANSEPIHMYDSKFSYRRALIEISSYFNLMAQLAKENTMAASPKPTIKNLYLNFKEYRKLINGNS